MKNVHSVLKSDFFFAYQSGSPSVLFLARVICILSLLFLYLLSNVFVLNIMPAIIVSYLHREYFITRHGATFNHDDKHAVDPGQSLKLIATLYMHVIDVYKESMFYNIRLILPLHFPSCLLC